MEKHTARVQRFAQPPLYLLTPVVLLLALIGGSFVGRECEITCDRTEGSCRTTSSGYLFPIERDSVPIASILGVAQTRAETSHQSGRVGGSSRSTISTTEYSVFFALDPRIAHRPWLELHTYDRLSSGAATAKAVEAVSAFLSNPEQTTVTARFGSHRSGYAMSLLILIVGLGALSFRYAWQLSSKAERNWTKKSPESRLKFSIDVPLLGMSHANFEVIVNGNQAPISDDQWAKELPARAPVKLRAEILKNIQQEHAFFDEHVMMKRKGKKQ